MWTQHGFQTILKRLQVLASFRVIRYICQNVLKHPGRVAINLYSLLLQAILLIREVNTALQAILKFGSKQHLPNSVACRVSSSQSKNKKSCYTCTYIMADARGPQGGAQI